MSDTVYVALDLEATEMIPERGEIIELGAIKFTTGRIVDRWSATVRPRGRVPFAITQLTGITEAEVRRAAPFAAVAPALAAFVRNHPIVGQSIWLDADMIRAAGLNLTNPLYDTFELATLTLPGLPVYGLRHIAGRLNVALPVEHRALADAAVTVEVFRRLVNRLLEFDAETVGEIARLLADARSPLAPLVRDLAREKAREGFGDGGSFGAIGASIRQQLAARALSEERTMDALFLMPRQRPDRLDPTGSTAPIDTDGLYALFAADGAFARAFPGYEHRASQLRMMEEVSRTFNEGGQLVAEAGTGTGKALDIDTPIPTPAGWKRLGDLQAGDSAFDEHGHPCTVTAAWPVLRDRPCYEVVFSDGSVLVADSEHLWASYTRRDRKRDHNYHRNKGVKRQTRGSPENIARAKAALARYAIEDQTTIPGVLDAVGTAHLSPMGGVARSLPVLGQGERGADLSDARTLLSRIIDKLSLPARDQRGHQTPAYSILTTEQLRQTLTDGRGACNHAIPVAGPAHYPATKLPIDPYYLGYWLGDGMSNSSAITTADPEILDFLTDAGFIAYRRPARYRYSVFDANGPGKHRWGPSLTRSLRLLGVIKNKHIPGLYLTSSEEQRRALLAGLLDSDGTVSHSGIAQFTTTKRRLAEGVHELACSLGYRATLTESRATLNGKDCGTEWMVAFTTRDTVFRLTRKRQAHQERAANYSAARNRYRYVVDVRPVPSRPVRCITVDSPNSLYLAGKTFIPTHNSIAYLIPAVIHAAERGETVVISTATIGLQDQLFRKDIPDVLRVLGEIARDAKPQGKQQEQATADVPGSFEAALLKGRSNYLCLRRWFALRKSPQHSQEDAHLLAKTMVWLQETDSGDRAELLLLPDEQPAWNKLAEHEGSCVASQCVFQKRGQCFLYRARRQAESAHIVVVNHALLLSDLGTDGGVLPPYQHLVIDEAHHLEAEATRQFGFEVDAARIAAHLDTIRPAAGARGDGPVRGRVGASGATVGALAELRARLNVTKGAAAREAKARVDEAIEPIWRAADEARDVGGLFFAHLAAFIGKHGTESGAYDQRLRLTGDLRAAGDWPEVEAAWEALHGPLLRIAEGLTTILLALDKVGDELEGREDLLMELTLTQRANAELRLHGATAVGRPDPNMVYWIAAGSGNERIGLHAAPLHVGPTLARTLFDQKRTVILTSATLSTEGKFAFIRERLGLTGEEREARVRELRVASPFDYHANALLYLADDIPEPGSPGYQKALNEALIGLCQASDGRALLLFTSYNALQTTYRAIKTPLERAGVLVLGQRIDGSPRQLLDRFRANPRSIILGAASFWEGVDVVGDTLSVLAITRLPFAVPTDPVFAARSEQFDDAFSDYAVPHAILRFKQGFGRLIRSATDRGICAILDRRVLTKRYGRAFIDSLPPCAEVRGPISDLGPQATEWLAQPRR